MCKNIEILGFSNILVYLKNIMISKYFKVLVLKFINRDIYLKK